MDGISEKRLSELVKLSPVKIADKDANKMKVARRIVPARLLSVPGVVNQHTEYTNSIAKYPNRATAFCGALAFLSFAAGRRYRMKDNSRPNIYIVCIANSGAGKDAPRRSNFEIAKGCGVMGNVADAIASGEGLEDMILEKSKVLMQSDEIDTLLRAISEDKSGGKESLMRVLLSAFSSSGSYLAKRRKSMSGGPKVATGPKADYCVHPSVTLYGSAVPAYFYGALNERTLANGLVARCMVVDCGVRGKQNEDCGYRDPPVELMETYRTIFGTEVGADGYAHIADNPERANDPMHEVTISPDARSEFKKLDERWDREYHACDDVAGNAYIEAEQSFRARTAEHVMKMAMLYAISENPSYPMISLAALNWAADFVEWCQGSMIDSMKVYCSINEFDEMMQRVIRMFGRKKQLTVREISRGLRQPIATIREVISAMVTNGTISPVINDAGDVETYYLTE